MEGTNALCPGNFDLSRACADGLLTIEGLDVVGPKVLLAFILALTFGCALGRDVPCQHVRQHCSSPHCRGHILCFRPCDGYGDTLVPLKLSNM